MLAVYRETTENTEVEVSPFFVPEQSNKEDMYYLYGYDVKITNNHPFPIQLLSREWTIRDGNRHTEYIQGEGILGEQPTIEPGQTHQYTSFCPLQTPTGNMRGKYEFKDHQGQTFWLNVPVFFFRPPYTFT